MPKLSIAIAVTTMLIGATACDRSKITRETRDVEKAREDIHEEQLKEQREVEKAKTELEKQQAELNEEIQKEINDAEERYLEIEKDATTVTGQLKTAGHTHHIAELEQARTLARNRIDDARKATTAEAARDALKAANDALDDYEKQVRDHGGKV